MPDIVVKVIFNQLTLDDLVAIEEGDQSARFVRSILSRFMINPETGDYYPQDRAILEAGKLNLDQAGAAVTEFAEQVKELKAKKLPPTKSGS